MTVMENSSGEHVLMFFTKNFSHRKDKHCQCVLPAVLIFTRFPIHLSLRINGSNHARRFFWHPVTYKSHGSESEAIAFHFSTSLGGTRQDDCMERLQNVTTCCSGVWPRKC